MGLRSGTLKDVIGWAAMHLFPHNWYTAYLYLRDCKTDVNGFSKAKSGLFCFETIYVSIRIPFN